MQRCFYAGHSVPDVLSRVGPVGLTIGQQAVGHALLLAALLVLREHRLLAAEGDGPQRVFGGIIPRPGL